MVMVPSLEIGQPFKACKNVLNSLYGEHGKDVQTAQ